VYPIVVVLLDGLGDRAHDVLGGKTGNEAATTPNLDRLATAGSCGVLYAVGPGRAPSSEVAHWSMLGYRPDEFPGRAVFEALGRGQEVSDEHVFAYAALRPAERRDDGLWLTGRPDPQRDAEDAQRLVERCDGIEIDGLTFALAHLWRGEAVLRIGGGADERVTDTDAFFRAWHPMLRPLPLVPEAERTARACEEWTREDTIERMRRQYEYRKRRFAARAGKIEDDGYEDRSLAYQQVVQAVLGAQRDALIQLRNSGEISNETMNQVIQELDLEESRLEI